MQKRAFRSFLECAADHGVRYRGPFADSNGEGVLFGLAPGQEDSSADRLRVSRHCPQMLVGTFATPPPGGLEIALLEKTAVRFAKCLRAHGLPDFPLPRFSESDPFHALEQLPFHRKSQRFVDVVNDRIEPVRSYVFST